MILYEVFPNKTLKPLEDEKTYITENLISSVHIKLPSTFGDYPVKKLTAELRFYFPEGDYMAYTVDTQQAHPEVPITNDITEKPQTLSVMLFFYKGGNVIGKTNTIEKVIHDAPLKGEPLTPREEFDEVIAEQRETIAEQAETITEQAGTITEQGEQITELSGEVTELTTENTRLETLTETQRETIQNMLDNPPQPKLYTPPVVTPSGIVQQISPPTGYDGLNNAVVDRVSAEGVGFHSEWYKEGKECLGKVGTYNPFPEHSYGGIYYTELGEGGYPKKILIKDMLRSTSTIPQFFNASNDAKRELREVVFENCPEILTIPINIFNGFNYLTTMILPDSLTSIGYNAFYNCTSLTEINLPDSLASIGSNAFQNCTSLTNLTIAQGFNCNGLNVSASTRFTAETIVACLEALADRTGQTAYTITFGTTNLNKLTAEQKAIATNKNWNLA